MLEFLELQILPDDDFFRPLFRNAKVPHNVLVIPLFNERVKFLVSLQRMENGSLSVLFSIDLIFKLHYLLFHPSTLVFVGDLDLIINEHFLKLSVGKGVFLSAHEKRFFISFGIVTNFLKVVLNRRFFIALVLGDEGVLFLVD